METLEIISLMSHFRLISKVAATTSDCLEAEAVLERAPRYTGLEIMAQTAALHVRQKLEFERHAFLLSVQQCTLPQTDFLKGRYRIKAVLRNQSSDAFRYIVEANGSDHRHFDSDLLIGTRSFDDRFPKALLAAHYQRIWTQLKEE